MPGRAFCCAAAAFCLLALAGCTSPEEPITAIVVDTYYPVDIGGLSVGFTFLDLFDSAGDTGGAYDIFTTNSTGAPAALGWSDGSNAPDPDHVAFAHVSYTGTIQRGVPYYVRVRGINSTDEGPFAIRLLAAEPDPFTDYPRDSSWYFGSENSLDPPGLPVEGGNGVPAAFQELALNDKLNCYIIAGEVDWFRFVLP